MPKTAREILERILNHNCEYGIKKNAEEILSNHDFLEQLARERFEIEYWERNIYKPKIKVKE